MTYYMARRYLGLSFSEWDQLPWYEARAYVEGFKAEGLVETGEVDPSVTRSSTRHEGGATIVEREHEVVFGVDAGELNAFGFKETTL